MKTRFLFQLGMSLILTVALTTPLFSQYQVTTSSYLGGSSDSDRVYGSEVLKDGTIVLAANISDASFGGITTKTLNGATASSPGAVIRLSADGKTVLSVTRLSDHVSDLSLDASDRLYVAAGEGGAVVLNSTASTVLKQVSYSERVHRIDATPAGGFVALVSSSGYDNKIIRDVTLSLYDANWNELNTWKAGMQYTTDACVDETTQTVVAIGFKNITAVDDSPRGRNPVDVAIYKGWDFAGQEKYKGYDWNGTEGDARWINQPTNNMADSRGARCSMGDDGQLYMSFAVDGGNHIFRYDPFNITQQADIVGGDKYHVFFNTGTQKKTFFGRYNVATGAYLLGQQFCTRASSNVGNTAHPELGDIKADASGNVYLVGESASGLPMTYDPLPEEYSGGAFILIMDASFTTRTLCTRLATFYTSASHSVAVRDGKVVMGGTVASDQRLYTQAALDASANGNDGFFTVFNGGTSTPPPPPTGGDTRDAFALIEAESLNDQQGLEVFDQGFGYFDQGDWAQYENVDFADGAQSVELRIAVDDALAGQTIELRIDSPTGDLIGSHVVQGTGSWSDYQTQIASVSVSGVHDLYLVGKGQEGIANLEWLRFSASSPQTPTPPTTGRDALARIEAESADASQNVTINSSIISYFDGGDWLKYDAVNFGSGVSWVDVSIATKNSERSVELRLDSPTGSLIGVLMVKPTGDWNQYEVQRAGLSNATGVHDVYLVAKGGEGVGNIDWFSFGGSSSAQSASVLSPGYAGATASTSISIYPNPVVDGIIRMVVPGGGATVRVYNRQGGLVLTRQIGDRGAVQLPALPSGVYLVWVETAQESYTQKVIVENR